MSEGVLDEFSAWFKDPSTKKVWHNYGFDRHVLFNEGIDCLGFAGDTMHMARLWDSSRDKAVPSAGRFTHPPTHSTSFEPPRPPLPP